MNIMIKPVSGRCNLGCRYCFYKEGHETAAPMSASDACHVLDSLAPYLRCGYPLVFQGGEPLLAGYDFFAAVIGHLSKLGYAGQVSVQTNGTLIDDRMAALFAENGVLVGVSLDGDELSHSVYREDFAGVMRGIGHLEKAGCDFNILTVVTDETAARIGQIYEFYRREGFDYQQYIPCIGAWRLSDAAYGEFLVRLFRLWRDDIAAGRRVYIRLFENIRMILSGAYPEDCGAAGVCTPQLLIEADGSVYPCDFYVKDDLKLGNILTDSVEDILNAPAGARFTESSWELPEQCSRCRFIDLCRGGCRRYRNDDGLFLYCNAYRRFFRECIKEFEDIAY